MSQPAIIVEPSPMDLEGSRIAKRILSIILVDSQSKNPISKNPPSLKNVEEVADPMQGLEPCNTTMSGKSFGPTDSTGSIYRLFFSLGPRNEWKKAQVETNGSVRG
ncbi:hypothetical protein ACOSQ2_015528 [Xanthoceras sorbifolium]